MKSTGVLERYLKICNRNLEGDSRFLPLLKGKRISKTFLINNFSLGFLTMLGRNNFHTLRYYEYLQPIKSNKGLANRYRLTTNYSNLDFLNTILSPEELRIRIADIKYKYT